MRLNLVSPPNDYRVIVEYFYPGLEDLTLNVTFYDGDGDVISEGTCDTCVLANHEILCAMDG